MTTGRVCPKCHYQRKPDDDSYPKYECPKCGIIYDKFIPPEEPTTSKNKTEGVPNTKISPDSKNFRTFSISGRHIIFIVLMLTTVYVVYTVFMKPSGSKSNLSGTYTGECSLDDKSVYVEFDIDEQMRVKRILKKQTRQIYGGKYEAKDTYLWQYPDIVKMESSYRNYSYIFKKNGNKFVIKMNDSKGDVSINSTFSIVDYENSQPDIEIKKFTTDQDIFRIQFSYRMFKKTHKVKISREDVKIPEQFLLDDVGKYCPSAGKDIHKIPEEARKRFYYNKYSPLPYSYSLSPDFNQCRLRLLFKYFRPKLHFKIRTGEIRTYLQHIVDHDMARSDMFLYTNTDDPMLTLEIPEQTFYASMSLNAKGYGQFSHAVGPDKRSFFVSKIDLDSSKADIKNSIEEWKTVFVKSDPRYKNGTFKAVEKRQQEARKAMEKKMKLQGAE